MSTSLATTTKAAAASAALAAQFKQQRFNPLRSVTPASLGASIDRFDAGYLRDFAMAAREIMERDDTLAVAVPKRKKQVSRRRWDVLIGEDVADDAKTQAAARRHQQVLKYFYSNLRVRNAVDRDEQGGLRLLLRRMMEAQFVRYAAAEIVWRPSPAGLTADLHVVPLEFLEATTGELRFCGVNGYIGQPIDRNNWLIAVADGAIMKAAAVCYMFKRLSLQDWLNLSAKFGVPGIHGETNAAPGSAEWNAFVSALESFSNDWIVATSAGSKVNILEAGAKGESPFAPMVERMDRAMARLCMGSDLSTLSRQDGTGASLQGEDTDELIADDCEWLSELLNEQLSRRVIEWAFGPGTTPLAYFQLIGPQKQDVQLEMKVDEHVTKHGVKLSIDDVAERYGRTHVESEPAPQPPAANDQVNQARAAQRGVLLQRLRDGVHADLTPAVNALITLEEASSPAALRAALLAIDVTAIEGQVLAGTATNDALDVVLAAEFLAGLAGLAGSNEKKEEAR